MIYTWDQPEADARARVPDQRATPELSFTAILPARHEEAVTRHATARAASADYPPHLVQILVVCSADDVGTITQAQVQVDRLRAMGRTNVEVVVFDDGPINKPHGLNTALRHATNDVVAIFDAEDEVQRELFDIVNTI